VAIFVRRVGCCSSEASRTPAEVTKRTYEVIDDFENSNHGNKVQWACAGGGGRMAEAQFAWCPHVAIFVRWVGYCSSEVTQTPAEVIKHTYEMMGDFEYSNCGKQVRFVCAGGVKGWPRPHWHWSMVVQCCDICPLGDFLTPKCQLDVQNQRQMRLKLGYNIHKLFFTCVKGLYSSIAVQVRISPTLK